MNHDGGMFFAGAFMWLFWIGLIIVIIFIVRNLLGSNKEFPGSKNESPLTILKKRYARGEINEDEFKNIRKNLQD